MSVEAVLNEVARRVAITAGAVGVAHEMLGSRSSPADIDQSVLDRRPQLDREPFDDRIGARQRSRHRSSAKHPQHQQCALRLRVRDGGEAQVVPVDEEPTDEAWRVRGAAADLCAPTAPLHMSTARRESGAGASRAPCGRRKRDPAHVDRRPPAVYADVPSSSGRAREQAGQSRAGAFSSAPLRRGRRNRLLKGANDRRWPLDQPSSPADACTRAQFLRDACRES